VKHHLVLPDKQERDFTLVKPLTMQLADAGHSRATITRLALSHYHYDHTANANLFPKAAWLVTDVEREAMFAVPPRGSTRPSTYEGLRTGGVIQITGDDHDVFGDGTVVIKAARGHTEGHQVLYVKLARTGGVVLAGDLYHYPEERTLDRVPIFEFDAQQTRAATNLNLSCGFSTISTPTRNSRKHRSTTTRENAPQYAAARAGPAALRPFLWSSLHFSAERWKTGAA
jgi:glyoxylase-like metal-dependent hydrolase (beta-lactamase superfamily II)